MKISPFALKKLRDSFSVVILSVFVGGLFALMIKLLPWLLLAVVVVWVIRALKTPDGNAFRDNNRWRY